jgi:hypothetical protein
VVNVIKILFGVLLFAGWIIWILLTSATNDNTVALIGKSLLIYVVVFYLPTVLWLLSQNAEPGEEVSWQKRFLRNATALSLAFLYSCPVIPALAFLLADVPPSPHAFYSSPRALYYGALTVLVLAGILVTRKIARHWGYFIFWPRPSTSSTVTLCQAVRRVRAGRVAAEFRREPVAHEATLVIARHDCQSSASQTLSYISRQRDKASPPRL